MRVFVWRSEHHRHGWIGVVVSLEDGHELHLHFDGTARLVRSEGDVSSFSHAMWERIL